MISIVFSLALAHADPKVGRAEALLNTLWSHVTGRFPRVPVMDLNPADDGVWINGAFLQLEAPRRALARLTEITTLGFMKDGPRLWLLASTREPDPTLILAHYDVGLRRLKLLGFDKRTEVLPGDVAPEVTAHAAAKSPNVTLIKYLTTRSPAMLAITREELAADYSCHVTSRPRLAEEIARASLALGSGESFAARTREIAGHFDFIDLNPAAFCHPKRLNVWKDALIVLHGHVQAELNDVAADDLG